MNRSAALEVLRRLRPRLEARGIAHAGVFGSASRDELRDASDVDIVLTPAQQVRLNLFDLGGIQSELEDAFSGFDVDLLVEPIADVELRRTVSRDRLDAF